ncbi:predicted protein [Nematostella vectensis]|uniref:Uncharacterized protein n=2 Tax=Nematostella vectensis TaxID=45351 RepID=A7RZX3_NEMVE|nr:predicted protein [Nematostella vectensis]|eukprot:XP_001635085.1 predicted protein [Nematostella vectensis]
MDWELCLSVTAAIVLAWLSFRFIKRFVYPQTLLGDLPNRHVLITGCDSGFGRAAAIKLDELGLSVFAGCLTESGASKLARQCSDRLQTLILDVTNPDDIKKAHEQVKQHLPQHTGLWGLVNNAGIAMFTAVELTPLSEYKKMADVNLWGLIDVTLTFLPLIRKCGGRVVNISSIAGRLSIPNTGPYSVTKYGVEAFSDALRREVSPWGVKVTLVEPGGFHTRFLAEGALEKKLQTLWESANEQLRNDYGEDNYKTQMASLKAISLIASSDLSEVVEAIAQGILASSPGTRCLVGKDARFIYWWLTILPTSTADWLIAVGSRLVRRFLA